MDLSTEKTDKSLGAANKLGARAKKFIYLMMLNQVKAQRLDNIGKTTVAEDLHRLAIATMKAKTFQAKH